MNNGKTEKSMTEEEALTAIVAACGAIGWQVSFKSDEEDIHGMIIGSSSYIDDILSHLPPTPRASS